MKLLLTFYCLLLSTACVYTPQANTTGNSSNEDTTNKADTIVTRYQEGDNTIEESRVKGFLYSVKVIPKVGKPYYLINADGNNTTLQNRGPQQKMPSWTLFNW